MSLFDFINSVKVSDDEKTILAALSDTYPEIKKDHNNYIKALKKDVEELKKKCIEENKLYKEYQNCKNTLDNIHLMNFVLKTYIYCLSTNDEKHEKIISMYENLKKYRESTSSYK